MASVRLPISARVLSVAGLAALLILLQRQSIVRALDTEVVRLEPGAAVQIATPPFLEAGKRYAFTWPGGGPPQTCVVKQIRPDGWILVDVADDNARPELYIPGEFPTRWLHVGLAVSVQEMRALP